MDKPSVEALARFMKRQSPNSDDRDSLTECLDLAVEYVEQLTGPLADREGGQAMAREAIMIIAKHEYGVRQNPSAQSAQYANGDYTPGPAGYLIPHRAKTLIDALRFDSPASIGIG